MAVTYHWLNDDHSIMSFMFRPDATWDDFYNVSFAAFEEIFLVNHPVDIIIDVSRVSHHPSMILKELLHLTHIEQGNVRCRVLISSNPLFKTIFDVFSRTYPKSSQRLMLCYSMEDAYFLIDQLAPPEF